MRSDYTAAKLRIIFCSSKKMGKKKLHTPGKTVRKTVRKRCDTLHGKGSHTAVRLPSGGIVVMYPLRGYFTMYFLPLTM